MSGAEAKKTKSGRSKEFHASMTGEFIGALTVNAVIAIVVSLMGLHFNQMWRDHRGDPFIAFGAILILAALVAARITLDKSMVLTESGITYRQGSKSFNCSWKQLRTFVPTRRRKKIFRTTLIGDHATTVSFDSTSFKDYDVIVNIISVARERAEDSAFVT
jgi:predicted membrane channel-forming protein YqfA (hemolysin III family)